MSNESEFIVCRQSLHKDSQLCLVGKIFGQEITVRSSRIKVAVSLSLRIHYASGRAISSSQCPIMHVLLALVMALHLNSVRGQDCYTSNRQPCTRQLCVGWTYSIESEVAIRSIDPKGVGQTYYFPPNTCPESSTNPDVLKQYVNTIDCYLISQTIKSCGAFTGSYRRIPASQLNIDCDSRTVLTFKVTPAMNNTLITVYTDIGTGGVDRRLSGRFVIDVNGSDCGPDPSSSETKKSSLLLLVILFAMSIAL